MKCVCSQCNIFCINFWILSFVLFADMEPHPTPTHVISGALNAFNVVPRFRTNISCFETIAIVKLIFTNSVSRPEKKRKPSSCGPCLQTWKGFRQQNSIFDLILGILLLPSPWASAEAAVSLVVTFAVPTLRHAWEKGSNAFSTHAAPLQAASAPTLPSDRSGLILTSHRLLPLDCGDGLPYQEYPLRLENPNQQQSLYRPSALAMPRQGHASFRGQQASLKRRHESPPSRHMEFISTRYQRLCPFLPLGFIPFWKNQPSAASERFEIQKKNKKAACCHSSKKDFDVCQRNKTVTPWCAALFLREHHTVAREQHQFYILLVVFTPPATQRLMFQFICPIGSFNFQR